MSGVDLKDKRRGWWGDGTANSFQESWEGGDQRSKRLAGFHKAEEAQRLGSRPGIRNGSSEKLPVLCWPGSEERSWVLS